MSSVNSGISNVERLFDLGLEQKIYSAGAIAIGKGDRVLFEKAAGHVSYEPDAAAVTVNTKFDMASCSKILGPTFAAFHMIESGDLCLEDTLGELLDECPEDKKRITVKNLMTHTSGLPAEILLWKELTDPSEVLNCILSTPLVYPTGTNVTYSCMGYITLAKIMEKLSGMPLDEMARKWTFDPLGMKDTEYRGNDLASEDKTIAYTEVKSLFYEGIPGVVHDENARFIGGVSGNAGVFSTLHDLELFAAMLSKDGEPLVTKRLMDIARVNYTPGLDENRGLGFQLSGPAATFFGDLFGNDGFGHTGYTGTSIAVDAKTGLYVVYLTNRVYPSRSEGRLTRLRHQIHNAAVKEFIGF